MRFYDTIFIDSRGNGRARQIRLNLPAIDLEPEDSDGTVLWRSKDFPGGMPPPAAPALPAPMGVR